MVCLQEELIGVKLREAEALTGLKELRQQVRDLEEHWQVNTHTHRGFYTQFENMCKCVCKLYCVAALPCAVPFMLPFNSPMFKYGTLALLCRGIWRARQAAGKTVRGRMQRVSFRMSWWAWGSERQRHRLSSEKSDRGCWNWRPRSHLHTIAHLCWTCVGCLWEGQFLSLFKGCPRLRIYIVKSYVWGQVRQNTFPRVK